MEEIQAIGIKDLGLFAMPEDVEDVDDFIDFLNYNSGKFVKLYRIGCHDCVFPFLIEEFIEYTPVCVNISSYNEYEIETVYILSKEAYDERLTQLIEENCQDCVNYEEGDDIDSHRNHMCLDGVCPYYEEKSDCDDEDDYDDELR